ncbi:MAG TPA: EAL domain-containing protein [Sulfuricella sp.]|nr:EAL domain-containing protein [Sulfuricella sp.]
MRYDLILPRYRIFIPSLIVGLFLLAGILFFTYNASFVVDAEEDEEKTGQILFYAEHWFSDLQALELAQNRYLNSGEQEYLVPSENGINRERVVRQLEDIKASISKRFPELLPKVVHLASLQQNHFSKIDHAIAARRKGKPVSASEQDMRFLELMRVALNSVTDPVHEERDRINAQVSDSVVRGSISFSLVTLVMIAILIIGYRITRRTLRADEESHRKLQGILETALDAVVMMNSKGIITDWNGNAEKTFGWSRAEAVGRMLHETIIPPRHRDGHVSGLTRFLAGGEGRMLNSRVETTALHRDGHEFLVELAITPIKTGDKYEFSAFIRDITERKQTEKAMLRESEKNRMLLQASSDGIHIMDTDGNVIQVSDSFCRMLGYSQQEMQSMNVTQWDARLPKPELQESVARLRNSSTVLETQHRHRDGHLIDMEISATGVEIDGRRMVYAAARDITERKRMDDALRRSEAKLAAIFDLAPDPTFISRLADGVLLSISRSFAAYTGYTAEEAVGRSILTRDLSLCHNSENRKRWESQLREHGEVIDYETVFRLKDGTERDVSISGRVVDIGKEPCVITIVHDITERKRHEEHLEQIAHYDSLTHLPNRRLLSDRLQQSIAQNQRTETMLAVCYLDLDGFKQVNDTLGHEAGDRLLVEVAERLKSTVRGGDTVARLGGDEFVLLLSGLADDEECQSILNRTLKMIAAPYSLQNTLQRGISASIGVAIFPRDSLEPDTLLGFADHAMYAAKQAGKNRFQLLDSRIERRIKARHDTLRRIKSALDNGQFRLFYQPKVDCRRGRVLGVEALIRWDNPLLGLLTPAEFLPLIEMDEMAPIVGKWVVHEALRQVAAWHRNGIDLHISVNAFIQQLQEPDFAGQLGTLLAEYPEVAHERLTIEIVESSALKELDTLRRVIGACQSLGVRFAIDDFGTGYSSLHYLRHVPAQEIKIDKTFVGGMLTDAENLAVVQGVIGLGAAFQRSVVAEGVETPEQIVRLLELGCDVMQGYALAPPMEAADVPAWVRDFRPSPTWSKKKGAA